MRDGASGAPVPRWRPAGVSAPVFCAGVHGKERMEVLVGVAKALAEAHRVGWLHRRLAPQCVVVPVGFGGGGGLEMSAVSEVEGGEGGAGFVKVLQFSCAITGCGGGCEPCAARNAKAAKRRADLHQRYGTLEHSDVFCCDLDAAYEAPMEYDVRSFAKFLLWLYAGRMDEEDEAGYEDCLGDPEGDLAKVPWPLRWIVVDAERPGEEGVKNLTMEVVLMFLEALRSGRATPHDGGDGYLPAARQKEETQSVYLRAACMRSAAVGMMTLEPEACMHMGRFWEEDAEYHRQMVYGAGEAVCGVGFGNAGNAQARQEYCNAVECFAVAARLGCAQGLVEIARVDALSLRCPFYMRDGVSRCTTLRLLLAAAVLGNIQARCCLAAVPSAGVDNLPELIAQPAGKGSWLLAVEPQLLEACVGVAKCWRRGQADLPVDLEEAEAWLEVAVNRGHPGAALECGLLFVQDANTPSRMEKGVDLVRRASHSFPSPAGKEAYFWLAHWHSLRLRWEPIVTPPPNSSVEPAIVVDKDPVKAAVYAKAASDAEHNDAMAMYSRLLRLGHSPVVKNVDASKRLNKRARDANSGAAFYGYALRKIAEARKAWNGRNKMMIIDASQRGTRSPSAGPASVASVDVISAYRNIPAPLSRYEEPASSPTVSHVTSGSSVTASSVPPLSMSPVPQREVATSGRTSGYRSRVGLGLPRNRDASGISSSTRGPGSAAPGRGSVVAKHVRENSNVGSASDLRRSASGSTNSIPNAVGRLDSAMSKVEVGNEVLVDLETGLLTPAGIVVHLQNALTAYLAPFSEVDENGAHRMPVESANPRPLFLAATCILDNMVSEGRSSLVSLGSPFSFSHLPPLISYLTLLERRCMRVLALLTMSVRLSRICGRLPSTGVVMDLVLSNEASL